MCKNLKKMCKNLKKCVKNKYFFYKSIKENKINK